MKRQWYDIQAEADTAHLRIFSEIGRSYANDDAVTAEQCARDIAALPASVKAIAVYINSYGGSIAEASAIFNTLREQASKGRAISTINQGIAASAASLILCAGTVRKAASNSLTMLHLPWLVTVGNIGDHERSITALQAFQRSLIDTYSSVTSIAADELLAMLTRETWLDASEALAGGFVTEIVEAHEEEPGAQNAIPRRAMASLNPPASHRARLEALLTPVIDATAVARWCAEAGLDLSFATPLLSSNAPVADIKAQIAAEQTRRSAAATRETHIRAVCKGAHVSVLADGYVRSGMAEADVRRHISDITALIDRVEIDASLGPVEGARHTRDSDPYGVHGKTSAGARA